MKVITKLAPSGFLAISRINILTVFLTSLCLLLAACVAEPVRLALTTKSLNETVSVGDVSTVNVVGTFSITDPTITADKVFLQLQDNAATFTMPASVAVTSNNGFTFTLNSLSGLNAGAHTGTLTIHACMDAACTQPYPNPAATISLPYTLTVNPVAEWSGMQRDAGHSGNVPITLNPAKFTKAWEWNLGNDLFGVINPVVTGNGHVYVSKDVGQGALYALNETDGTEAWKVSFGFVTTVNPPAANNGQVFVAVSGITDTNLWAYDALTGSLQHKSPFAALLQHLLAPTIYDNQVFTNGGNLGGDVLAFSTTDGSNLWTAHAGNNDMATPAVDSKNVYYHSGQSLEVWNRLTGASVLSIPDPYGTFNGSDYYGTPIIGGHNNVVSFSGDAFSGSLSGNVEQLTQRVLTSFRIDNKVIEWVTSNAYLTAPALAKGVIYAARNNPMSLDAIDETSGRVLWSWVPSGNGDTEFHRNIIVTNNLLFVSTDRAVYALDLTTKAPQWSYPKAGMLAISANRMLYIATGARSSDGHLVAIKLN